MKKNYQIAFAIIITFIVSLPVYTYLFTWVLAMVGFKPHDGTAVTAGAFACATAILMGIATEDK